MAERKPLDAAAVLLVVLLCLVWGVGHTAAKLAAEGISLVFQSGLRSAIATFLLFAWSRWQGIALFERDGTLPAGIVAGLLFGAEFLFIFGGLAYTDAARMAVFVYLAPCLTALGLHWFVPAERLGWLQWAGIGIAFAGIALAFADGFAAGRGTWLGDAAGVVAAALWAATTVVIRATKLASASATKTLFYQLAVSGPLLLAAALAIGEPGVTRLTPVVLGAFAYQCVVVAFASFLAWFWLLRHYSAARLSVFTFLTPLFGMIAGVLLLGEPLTPRFAAAALLVGAGIFLVNLRASR
ncbi:MAG: DMT family transporter [Burkholderiales bacterium]|nr:DMT family transporter [Burkholderiales bacterium]